MRCWACDGAVGGPTDAFGYLRCNACGLRFYGSGEAPRDAYDATYFSGYSGGNYLESEPVRRHESRVRLALLPRPRAATDQLFEIGSAAGFFLDEAQKAGWRAIGAEPSAEMAQFASSSFGLDVRVGFAEDMDLSGLAPRAVCAWHTLEHIPNPFELLVAVRERMADGGVLAMEVPNGASVRARLQGDAWAPLEPAVHVAQWTPTALRAILERAGFSKSRTTTVPFITYIDGLHRRFPRRVLLAARQRRWIVEPHADGHELLRVTAVR